MRSDYSAIHPTERPRPPVSLAPSFNAAAVREQLKAAGLLVAAGDAPPRQRRRAGAAWCIDADGLGRAAIEIFRHERALVRHVIEHGDPRVAAPLLRLVERERRGAKVA